MRIPTIPQAAQNLFVRLHVLIHSLENTLENCVQ